MSNLDWKYYEGTTSAGSIVADIAKVLSTAVKDEALVDDTGKVLRPSTVIPEANWDIVYPLPNWDEIDVLDRTNLSAAEFEKKIINQLKYINSTGEDFVILKTRAKADVGSVNINADDLGLENDLATDHVDMYVELYKPKYMANPEAYNPEVERLGIKPYNTTREIVKEFSTSVGNKSYGIIQSNLTDSTVVTRINKTVTQTAAPKRPTQAEVVNLSTPNGKVAAALYRAANGTSFASDVALNPSLATTVSSSITNKSLSDFTEDEISAIKILSTLSDDSFAKFTTITGQFYYYTGSYGVPGGLMLNFSLAAPNEVYQVKAGFKYILPEGDKVKTNSVSLYIGNSLQPSSYWKYDINTTSFTLLTALPGNNGNIDLNVDGDVRIVYDYEKEKIAVTGKKLIYNNHYIYMRMFDKLEDRADQANYKRGPKANETDAETGEVVTINSHVSEWSKLSWYQDFEEVMLDELDDDTSSTDLSQGIISLPIETPGLNADTRIRMWINCNNNRSIFVLMGNPSLDFSANRHLTSVCYLGRIESFENSINDTAGNFTLFTSSSTVPCCTKTKVNRSTLSESVIIGTGDGTSTQFKLKLAKGKFFDQNFPVTARCLSNGAEISSDLNPYTYAISEDKTTVTITFASAQPRTVNVIYADYNYYEEKIQNVDGITRDSFGNILNIIYPDTWGLNTATGVTDVCMLHTRSKAYFQKHHFMFTTTEEYMTKEMYGKSAYTNEYYADRIKITHGNDGPRGMLCDVLVIDKSSLVALDELIVNRDFAKDAKKPQETYVFFPINAPFSPFSGSPNATYGLALKKQVIQPKPTVDTESIKLVYDDLYIPDISNVTESFYLPISGDYGTTIEWTSSDDTVIAITDPTV